MKKNSRGFTLVELLVVIAIMGSILVLAITSLNKISKAKKNEAKKKVENQIELAAKQYFEANEYLFESLLAGNQGSFVTIPLERLIYNDYLNTLTDPTTGEKFDKCSNITVKRQKNKKYTFSYDSTDIGNCSVSSSYNYVLEDGQTLTIANTKKCYSKSNNREIEFTGGGNWCRGKVSLNFSASFIKGSGTISKIELKQNNRTVLSATNTSSTNYDDSVSSSNKKTITAVFETNKGNSVEQSVDYYIDNKLPVIFSNATDYKTNTVTEIDDINWINAKSDKEGIAYTAGYKDEHSGIDKTKSYYEWKKNSKSEKIFVSSMKNGTEEFGKYYAHKTIYHNDDGVYVDKFYICDIAENCAPMETKYYGIDKTPPKLEYKNTKNAATSNPSWTNQTAYFDVVATDLTSGINTNASFDTGNGTFYSIVDGTNKSVKNSSDLTKIPNGYKLAGDYLSNEGNRNKYHKVCDNAGNCTENTIYAKIDKTAPTLNYTITSKWLDGKTANANIYNGKCSINSAIKCPYENAKWTKDNISFNVTASDALSGINETSSFETNGTGSDENVSNKKGVFYVEWDNEPNGGSATTQFDIVTVNKNEQGKYIRNNAGYWAINYGKRRQSYTVCDKAGNCTTKTTYARFDKIAPEIINVSAPNGSSSSSYCSGKPVVATRFRVRDNAQVYNVYHYMSNEDVDINKDKDTLSYFTEGFNSVKNGGINIYNTLKTKKSDFKQVNDVNNNGTLYEMARYWADTDVSTANSIGCGTIAGNTKTPDYNYANQYCNFISAIDGAGNKTVSRICGSARKSSTNVKSK